MCEHYVVRGLCSDFPDWSIAVTGSETKVRIGYDYGRFVAGEKEQIVVNVSEEVCADGDQIVPDPLEERSMVATSTGVCMLLFS